MEDWLFGTHRGGENESTDVFTSFDPTLLITCLLLSE